MTLDRAVEEANQIKTAGTRMLAIGVGSALSNTASENRLQQISGPQVVRDADLDDVDSLNDIDVALVTDFEDLAPFLRSVVLQLCSPSLTIRKLAQTADDATYEPAQGWDMTVTPTRARRRLRLDPPDTTAAPSKTVPPTPTASPSSSGSRSHRRPTPPPRSPRTLEPATPPAGPGRQTDFRCEFHDEDGNVRVEEGEFVDPANPSFDLDPIGQEIVTCTVYNSFDYDPEIALTKVNAPTEVRGDLDPPATVTSTYDVTNPGNTPLANVTVTDDRCGPVTPVPAGGSNVGDADRQRPARPSEEWQFTCTRRSPRRVEAAGGTRPRQHGDVNGTDPTGTTVTARHRRRRRLQPGDHPDQAGQRRRRLASIPPGASHLHLPSPTPATHRSAPSSSTTTRLRARPRPAARTPPETTTRSSTWPRSGPTPARPP